MGSQPSSRLVILVLILTMFILFYMRAWRWQKAGFQQHGTPVSGGAKDTAEELAIKDSEALVKDGEGLTTKDGEELTTKDGEELTTKDGEGLTTKDGEGLTTKGGEGLTTKDGEGLTTKDGEGLTTKDGEGLTTKGGEGLTTKDGEGLTTKDGEELVTKGGKGLTTKDGEELVTKGGEGLTTKDGEELVTKGGEGLTNKDGEGLTTEGGEGLTTEGGEGLTTEGGEGLTTKGGEELAIDHVSPFPRNKSTLIPHIPREKHGGSDPDIPMPLLHKKDFHKLPQWDFEDVYTRNDQPRQITCPLSLWKSEDASFKKNFIPNINLFMHNRSVNMSEWNRLSHFNNPFGFMEYDYNEVKAAVEKIPKPQAPLLVASGDGEGCVSCAVVGTGGILNGSGMGKEIDGHNYVFRMNGAITQGYEEDVGKRTSIYLHTAHSLTSALFNNKEYGFRSIPRDEGIKYVMIPEGSRDFQWLQALLTGKLVHTGPYRHLRPSKYYSGKLDKKNFYLLHPDFMRYVRNRFLRSPGLDYEFWPVVRPSNGALALFLALHTCDVVNAYGFMTENYHEYPFHYYETHAKRKMNFYLTYDFTTEMNMWKKLHSAGIIKLYQRTDQ